MKIIMQYLESILNPINNIEEVFILLCDTLNIKISRRKVVNDLQRHPNYPSLSSIKDFLSTIGVPSIALNCKEKTNIELLHKSVIVQAADPATNKKYFALVYGHNDINIDWYNPILKKRCLIDKQSFYNMFTGYILYAEKRDDEFKNSLDSSNIEENRINILNSVLILFIPIFTLVSILQIFKSSHFVGMFCTIVLLLLGCTICAILLLHEYNEEIPIVKNICKHTQLLNCSAVLNSSGSRFWNIPWSVIGFSYYLGILFALLINSFNYDIYIEFAYVHLLSIPYILYSLYYQKYIVKQWCLLCLSIQTINLLLFFIIIALGGYNKIEFDVSLSLSLLGCFFLSSVSVYFLWIYSQSYKKEKYTHIILNQIKYNKGVFTSLLQQEKKIDISTDNYGIIIGNPNGKIQIIKVCNPYCYYCSKSHSILNQLVAKNNEIRIQIIFTENPESPDYKNFPIDTFLSLYYDGKDIDSILSNWYNSVDKDINIFKEKYGIKNPYTPQNTNNAKLMYNFFQAMGIKYTPTFFINGYKLPEVYNFEDLLYIY